MNTREKEAELLDIQFVTTILFIMSLVISLIITYNEKQSVLQKETILSDKQAADLAIFNRTFVLILSLIFLYINYQNKILAKEKKENLDPFNLQIIASEITILAAIIVLYVVISTEGNQYTIIPGVGNPSL